MMARFADGRVDHALPAEFREQAFGDFERAAVDADVFADEDDRGIAVHFLEHRLADGFEHGDRGHGLRCRALSARGGFRGRGLLARGKFRCAALAAGLLSVARLRRRFAAGGGVAKMDAARFARDVEALPTRRSPSTAPDRLRRCDFGGVTSAMRALPLRLRSCGSRRRNRRPARRVRAAAAANFRRIRGLRPGARSMCASISYLPLAVPEFIFGQKFFVARDGVARLPVFAHFLGNVFGGIVLGVAAHAHGFRFDQHGAVAGAAFARRLLSRCDRRRRRRCHPRCCWRCRRRWRGRRDSRWAPGAQRASNRPTDYFRGSARTARVCEAARFMPS